MLEKVVQLSVNCEPKPHADLQPPNIISYLILKVNFWVYAMYHLLTKHKINTQPTVLQINIANLSNDFVFLIFLHERHLRETFIEGRSSMFMKPSLYEKSETTFEIWNLRVDVSGAKKWTLIGLSTPTGLALDTFMGPNGSVITAPTVPVTHTLRVPINEYYPWVQIEDPRLDSRGMHYCTGRSQLCYKFYNSSRMDKTTLCCFGVSIDLLVMMQNDLGFRSEIYFTPDGNYGDFDEEKQAWNGIVQEVLSGQAEFAIDISMNAIRQEYLDFANPFIHLALNILVLKDLEANEGKYDFQSSLVGRPELTSFFKKKCGEF